MTAKVPEQSLALHRTTTSSCMASGKAPRFLTPRSRIKTIASRRLARHSSEDLPWLLAPGNLRTDVMYHGPSCSTIGVTRCACRIHRHQLRAPSGVTMHFDPENRSARGHRRLRTDWTEARRLASARECGGLLRHRSGARRATGRRHARRRVRPPIGRRRCGATMSTWSSSRRRTISWRRSRPKRRRPASTS